MQAVYSTYNITKRENQKGVRFDSKKSGYMERSERRSPYETYEFKPQKQSGKGKKHGAGALYIFFTVLLLILLYPVGLVFLWRKKLDWPVGTKIVMTVMTLVLFCVVLVVAMNYDTGNERIEKVQQKMRTVFEKVDYYTGDTVDAVTGWFTGKYEIGKENALKLWDSVDEHVAEKTLELYGKVDDNIYAAKVELPLMLLDTYKEKTDYEPRPVNTPAPVIKQATPDTGIKVVVSTLSTPEEVPEATPAPTPVPTPVPTPAPTPVPIDLPEIKDVALAEVFYTKNGTWYHAKKNCQNMVNAVSHTLSEAERDGKKVCDVCGVTPFTMIDCENYLWTDTAGYAHTSDECAEFAEGQYKIVPFDEVYNGSYKYCDVCGAETCYRYMRQNDAMYIADSAVIDDSMKALYDFERTITVYYGENSRKYHRTAECQYMNKDIYKHNLYQALHVDMKQICTLCNPLTEAQALEQMNSANAAN